VETLQREEEKRIDR